MTASIKPRLKAADSTWKVGRTRVSAESDLRATDVSLIQFDLVPNLILLLTVAGVVNCGLATAREFEDLTIKELSLAPISRATLIGGKLAAGWVTTMLLARVLLAAAAASGVLRPAGWFWLMALGVMALFALASAGLGALLGAWLRRFQPVIALGINISLYLFFLSGGIAVPSFLPQWVQTIALFTPTYYGVHAIQMAVFYQSTDLLGRDVAVLAGTSLVTVAAGALALRRRVSN